MSSGAIAFAELALVAGLVLGWGFWQLWTLKRDKRK
ncbi:MAG: hypothetical protein RJA94_3733 [Pseudomonadota bacterium]|jgi:hypothetical protein